MSELAGRSDGSTVVMICAEDELLCEQRTHELSQSFRRTGAWATFALEAVFSRCRTPLDPVEQIAQRWASNDDLFGHSDLVVFVRPASTNMLLASDFAVRPLGKPLPKIGATCPCIVSGIDSERKSWEVEYNIRNGATAKEAVVTARCSLCQRSWQLPTSCLPGHIHSQAGRFYVRIGLHAQHGWI
ncbi:hypothetical protein FRC08_014406 [Ceratobasidium sp. 394]|nr:hypothetical protein FRC08_014406 [Ceratobasidium sp. 394]